ESLGRYALPCLGSLVTWPCLGPRNRPLQFPFHRRRPQLNRQRSWLPTTPPSTLEPLNQAHIARASFGLKTHAPNPWKLLRSERVANVLRLPLRETQFGRARRLRSLQGWTSGTI